MKKSVDSLAIADLMTPDPITVTTAVSIEKTLAIMNAGSLLHLPVVDEEGLLLGMVSDRDLSVIRQIPGVMEISEEEIKEVLQAPIGVVLKSRFLVNQDVTILSASAPLQEGIDLLVATGYGAIPVVGDDEELVGILSVIDVLRWLGQD